MKQQQVRRHPAREAVDEPADELPSADRERTEQVLAAADRWLSKSTR
jgi:hypothetical protein